MVANGSILVTLVELVDRLPMPAVAAAGRGRPRVYSDRLFLKALVIMIVKRLPTVPLLLAVLDQPTVEMQQLRALLREQDRYPSRRTFERRLAAIPETLSAQIACLGVALLDLLQPWETCGQAAAIDSTVLRANGGVWHKKDREANIVPHTSIDTEAHWTKSGWHGWVYGWKLHLVTTVAAVWLPLAADVTPANTADNEWAFELLDTLLAEMRFLLGDSAYNDPELREECEARGMTLVTTRRGAYPHTDDGVEVRRIFHQLRSHAIENFNGQFKGIFDGRQPVPTRGLLATRRFALGAVLVYQLTVWHRFEAGDDLRVGLKPFLKAA
ncbi:MAG: transposase [Candidatus Rokuibacteriota bacterium]